MQRTSRSNSSKCTFIRINTKSRKFNQESSRNQRSFPKVSEFQRNIFKDSAVFEKKIKQLRATIQSRFHLESRFRLHPQLSMRPPSPTLCLDIRLHHQNPPSHSTPLRMFSLEHFFNLKCTQ